MKCGGCPLWEGKILGGHSVAPGRLRFMWKCKGTTEYSGDHECKMTPGELATYARALEKFTEESRSCATVVMEVIERRKEEILAMRAGRELDRLVAVKVMDHEVRNDDELWHNGTSGSKRKLAHYSTDIAAAWEVARHVNSYLYLRQHEGVENCWEAAFCDDEGLKLEARGDTAPEAICKAALLCTQNKMRVV